MFSLTAQVLGQQFPVEATDDGFGFSLTTSAGMVHARSLNEAIRIARQQLGNVLQRAERPGVPWGLYVSVGGVAAVYGEWPLLPGPPSDERRPESPVSRIRREWHDGDGPLSALENAIQIIRYYGRAGAMAA